MASTPLTLSLLGGTYTICRLTPRSGIPAWALAGGFFSLTRTPDELSVVCPVDDVPPGVTHQGTWRCLKVHGPLDFALTGILASLVSPLASGGVSVFAISTYDTDYLLIGDTDLERAVGLLTDAGHTVRLDH